MNRFSGNDEDGDAKPNAPVKTVDKATTHTTKRGVEPQAPVRAAGATGNRRGGPGGSEGGKFCSPQLRIPVIVLVNWQD